MKKIRTAAVLLSAASAVWSGARWCAAAAPPPAPAATPAAAATMDQPAFPIPLRALRAVQDVRERPIKWQQAADEAAKRIKDPALSKQVSQRLSAVGPLVAQELLAKPGETAVVSVSVFRDPGTETARLAAVSYEGRGDNLNPSFFPRLVADAPANAATGKKAAAVATAGTTQPSAAPLEMDPIASSYLCFYLDHADLMAGDVPHSIMKKSLDLAIQTARAKGTEAMLTGAAVSPTDAQAAASRADVDRRVQQARDDQRQIDQAAVSQTPAVAPNYYGGAPALPNGYYPGYGYYQPWITYLPTTGSVPVVVDSNNSQSGGLNGNGQTIGLGPNQPVQRDPRTGQPLPPQIVNVNAGNAPNNGSNSTPNGSAASSSGAPNIAAGGGASAPNSVPAQSNGNSGPTSPTGAPNIAAGGGASAPNSVPNQSSGNSNSQSTGRQNQPAPSAPQQAPAQGSRGGAAPAPAQRGK